MLEKEIRLNSMLEKEIRSNFYQPSLLKLSIPPDPAKMCPLPTPEQLFLPKSHALNSPGKHTTIFQAPMGFMDAMDKWRRAVEGGSSIDSTPKEVQQLRDRSTRERLEKNSRGTEPYTIEHSFQSRDAVEKVTKRAQEIYEESILNRPYGKKAYSWFQAYEKAESEHAEEVSKEKHAREKDVEEKKRQEYQRNWRGKRVYRRDSSEEYLSEEADVEREPDTSSGGGGIIGWTWKNFGGGTSQADNEESSETPSEDTSSGGGGIIGWAWKNFGGG